MKTLKILSISIVLFCFAGCIPSLHTIITEESKFFDDGIVGHWVNENADTIVVERAKSLNRGSALDVFISAHSRQKDSLNQEIKYLPYYHVTIFESQSGASGSVQLSAELTMIKGQKYIDLYPSENTDCEASEYFVPTHNFAKYRLDGENLWVQLFDTEHIEKLLKQKRIRLKHDIIEDNQLILTASTEELRRFLEKYGSDDQFFTESEMYNQVK